MKYLGTFEEAEPRLAPNDWYLIYNRSSKILFIGKYDYLSTFNEFIELSNFHLGSEDGIMSIEHDLLFKLTYEEIVNHVVVNIL